MQRSWAMGETMLREVWAAMSDIEHPIDQCLIILAALRLEQVATVPGVVLDLLIDDVIKLKLAAEASVRRHVRDLTCAWAKHAATTKTAPGCDNIAPYDLRSMPVEAAEELLELLNQCEDQLCVPLQVLCYFMCAIPKATGGERVIALMAMVMRVLAKCRRWRCTE